MDLIITDCLKQYINTMTMKSWSDRVNPVSSWMTSSQVCDCSSFQILTKQRPAHGHDVLSKGRWLISDDDIADVFEREFTTTFVCCTPSPEPPSESEFMSILFADGASKR